MTPSQWNPEWSKTFSFLSGNSEALQTMRSQLRPTTVPAGSTVFQPGSPCHHYLMVLEGSVKVSLTSVSGREVVLYRVQKSETCILTTSCLLASESYSATGTTETKVEVLMLEQHPFNQCLSTSETFRHFVFSSLGHRFSDLINRIEQVNFGTIDARLAEALLMHSHKSKLICITHQTLANELGTAREVVSRHLKQFESQQWVKLNRGSITVKNIEALQRVINAT